MAVIQERVDEKVFRGQSDKDVIAAWKEDFNTMLHIFNVRSVGSATRPLTAPFQAELAIDADVAAATEANQEVTNIRRGASVNKENVSNKRQLVCRVLSSPMKEC